MSESAKTPPAKTPQAKTPDKAPAKNARPRWSTRGTRYISRPVLLEEVGPPGVVRGTMMALSGGIVVFLVWASFTQLTQTTHVSGFVTPTGSVRVVQHLEGGIVAEILARDGALLDAGQPVITLEGTTAMSDLREQQARLVGLELHAERLRAFASDKVPDFTRYPAAYGGLIADQLAILKLQNEAHEKQRTVSLLQIAQRKAELSALQAQQRTYQRRAEIIGEIMSMREKLLKKGLVSRILYLNTKQELSDVLGEQRNTVEKVIRAKQAIAEARGELARIDADLRNQSVSEMGKLTTEIAAVRQAVKRLQDRATRLQVRAPVRGVLKGLAVNTIGSVVPAGGIVAEIVPADSELIVEARVPPTDIGQLRLGQNASVKIQTFDFGRYGSVEGVLEGISATTFTGDDGLVFYKVNIRLSQNHVGHQPGQNLILPGMTVDVNINTGGGSLMRYLLRPVYASLDTAFSEN